MIQILPILSALCLIILVIAKSIEIRKTRRAKNIDQDKSKLIDLKSKTSNPEYIPCSFCSGSGYTHIRLDNAESSQRLCTKCLGTGYQIEPNRRRISASRSSSGCVILFLILCTSYCLILILGLKFK